MYGADMRIATNDDFANSGDIAQTKSQSGQTVTEIYLRSKGEFRIGKEASKQNHMQKNPASPIGALLGALVLLAVAPFPAPGGNGRVFERKLREAAGQEGKRGDRR